MKSMKPVMETLIREMDIRNALWCSHARLVYVRGNGALHTEAVEVPDDTYGSRTLMQVLLGDVPLVQINSPACPTCESLLTTGYGIDKADCPQLRQIGDAINADFIDLDTSIAILSPLLGLLQSGLYVIADAICYPTDGNGNFFWSVPNQPTINPATAVFLGADDYQYIDGQPVFIYPTQSTKCYSEERVQLQIVFKKQTEGPGPYFTVVWSLLACCWTVITRRAHQLYWVSRFHVSRSSHSVVINIRLQKANPRVKCSPFRLFRHLYEIYPNAIYQTQRARQKGGLGVKFSLKRAA